MLLAMMDGRIRACTHLDVTAAMIEETLGLVREIARWVGGCCSCSPDERSDIGKNTTPLPDIAPLIRATTAAHRSREF